MSTYQSGFLYVIIHIMQEHFIPINRNMERPPRITVQPQDIWHCLDSLIRIFSMSYVLPERGWGLMADGV
jgi:hypothetical protein